MSRSVIFEDKIKIKKYACKTTPLAKYQKPIPTIVKPKQTRIRQIVQPTSKAKGKTTLPPDVENPKVLITQLTQLLNKIEKKRKKFLHS